MSTILGEFLTSPSSAQPTTQPSAGYVFTYFLNNGEDGLHLAISTDGLHWQAVGNGQSFLKPTVGKEKLMRDPCVLLGPDGVYRMVWTDSWTDRTIGYASSTDLSHWSAETAVPVMASEP
ncbi:MAG: glycosyl hydrolase, partial [Tepidisphaeraceae bacterium]